MGASGRAQSRWTDVVTGGSSKVWLKRALLGSVGLLLALAWTNGWSSDEPTFASGLALREALRLGCFHRDPSVTHA